MPATEVADRFRIAWSWWIAAELARRNPLLVYEYQPGGGQHDCLGLFPLSAPRQGSLIDLNRAGTLHTRGPHARTVATWADVAAGGPHDVVKALEDAAGLTPTPAPATVALTLSYRVLAHVLAGLVDSRDLWDVRSLSQDDSSAFGDDTLARTPWVAPFAGARQVLDARELPTLGWWGEPWSHLWAILRAGAPVVLVDVHGRAYTRDGCTHDLMAAYRTNGRRLGPTIAATIAPALP